MASELDELDLTIVLSRFEIIQPFLEDSIPLPNIVADENTYLSTARKWASRYRQDGLI